MAVRNLTRAAITDEPTPPPYRRALPRRVPAGVAYSVELLHMTTEAAYLERDRQLAEAVAREVQSDVDPDDDGDLTWGRASDDGDLTWGVRGATGRIQAGMTFRMPGVAA